MLMTSLSVFFPEDLITEIISLLPVKPLLRFKCVSNSWNTLISDPSFVKFHLKRSTTSPNPQFTLITNHLKPLRGDYSFESDWSMVPYPISRLLDNPLATFVVDSYYLLDNKESSIAGSCNGLICLVGHSFTNMFNEYQEYWLRLWNPATRKISQKIGYFRELHSFVFNFGWDDSAGTFKVVASRYIHDGHTSEVRVLTIGDNVWRNIGNLPVVPLGLELRGRRIDKGYEYGCVVSNTSFNWLASHKNMSFNWSYYVNDMTVEDLVIVSLNLGTETYNCYQLPPVELPPEEPTIGVLEECLCLCYSYKGTDIVIWLMKKFGVEDSWIQFLKISYHNLQLGYHFSFLPLFLSKDGDTLVLCSSHNEEAILYNLRDNNMQRIEVKVHKTIIDHETHNSLCLTLAQGYVESLISIC
ncbi:F-box/kelch-repeat protein At3g23880-like [Vicia villosa]|uniref:F-box/kelch-repeat protein At3g23880-like n=1 Tax=Vicia villosa TaxID=3911 RepID=UPI00273C2BF5|nr:F-box/kelch-repeat protein At3g23880-like [Vicia villosa]